MSTYSLAPEVYLSVAEEGAVFLDLHKDDYVGVDPVQAHALSLVVDGWPANENWPPEHDTVPFEEACAFAQDLCDRGLLVSAGAAVERDPSPPLPLAESELIPWEQMTGRRVRAGHVLNFLLAVAVAAILLRRRRFSRVVARVRARKSWRESAAEFQIEAVRDLVSAYFHIRAFVVGPKSRCLLDSLTLIEFLARYHVYPHWVIGVQVNPFASHSWVQHESFLLNGTPSYVRAYAPILVV